MIQQITTALETYFPPRARHLKRIDGEIVQPRRMTDPLQDPLGELLDSEHGIGIAMPGECDELRAALAFERALWRFDLALASFRERVQVN